LVNLPGLCLTASPLDAGQHDALDKVFLGKIVLHEEDHVGELSIQFVLAKDESARMP
jgi:hypothetical protein